MRLYLSFPEPRSAENPADRRADEERQHPGRQVCGREPGRGSTLSVGCGRDRLDGERGERREGATESDDSQERRFRADRRGEEGAERGSRAC